ncbi:MAG TPA: hypothetical protein VMP42_01335 [Actinomycetota bacterium]|nr:hypothetical protein [Actinomycetota bacterium]
MKARTGSRLAWALAAFSFATGIAALAMSVRNLGHPRIEAIDYSFLIAISAAAVGLLVATRRPDNPTGWVLLAMGTIGGVDGVAGQYALWSLTGATPLPGTEWAAWLFTWPIALVVPSGLLVVLILTFPTGRPMSPRWRALAVTGMGISVVQALATLLADEPIVIAPEVPRVANPTGIMASRGLYQALVLGALLCGAVVLVASALGLVIRFRRSRGDERLQLKWFAFAIATTVGAMATLTVLVLTLFPDQQDAAWVSWSFNVVIVGGFAVGLPVTCGIAITKHRLYDIDVVISKTLVYGALATFITAVYIGLVVGIGGLIGAREDGNLALQIGATALVAVLFQPVRSRIQRLANRLVYGARSTPYEVMAEFGERMAGSLRVEEVLPQVAEAAARGVGAAAARARIELSGGEVREAHWPADGEPEGEERVLPVTHRGESVGEIAVTKAPGDPLRPQDQALLRDLAAQAGLGLHNVRLAEDLRARVEQISRQAEELRASQQRIVTAADDARRLLERAIEERVERRIDDLAERLRAATGLIEEDPDRGAAALEEAGLRTQATLDELREIARGIYPPLLADKGLAAALDAQARRGGGTLRLRVEGVGRYGQEIEAGIYFCCLEAMQQGAEALTIDVREEQEVLRFAIELEDGLEGERLVRIADRVEALGGELVVADEAGTAISAMIPADPATIPA